MKIVLIFSAYCILSIHATGATIFTDTTQPRKPWKISQQQFLERYGKDDTSRRIIHYFLALRKTGKIITISAGLLTAGLGFYFDRVIVKGEGARLAPGGLVGFFWGIAVAATIWGLGITTLLSAYLWIAHPRKKLWKILNNYFSGKGIPPDLKKIFKKRVKLLPEN
ncbi:MAG TPA: hypothetical protein VET23_10325 [Chitinophagaceae bacterium]|nr:hypothetical protein [Chitinophagaceae bacterium]